VRRIRADLIAQLDLAVGELAKAKGLIIDVRGNSGGGFRCRSARCAISTRTTPRSPTVRVSPARSRC